MWKKLYIYASILLALFVVYWYFLRNYLNGSLLTEILTPPPIIPETPDVPIQQQTNQTATRSEIDKVLFRNWIEQNNFNTIGMRKLCALMLCQARHETGNYSSPIFMQINNLGGMKCVSVRTTSQIGCEERANGEVYGVYENASESIFDIWLWIVDSCRLNNGTKIWNNNGTINNIIFSIVPNANNNYGLIFDKLANERSRIWFNIVYGEGSIINENFVRDYAQAMKEGGYYTDTVNNYTNGMLAALPRVLNSLENNIAIFS